MEDKGSEEQHVAVIIFVVAEPECPGTGLCKAIFRIRPNHVNKSKVSSFLMRTDS